MGIAAALAGCAPSSGNTNVEVEDAWVRLPAVPGRPAAAYFHIRTDLGPTTLVRVDSPAAGRAEMHESMSHGGMEAMTPLPKVVIPYDGVETFEPGGRHVMLYDLDPQVKAGGTMPLRLYFAEPRAPNDDRAPYMVDAKVVGPADPAPTP